MIAGGNMSRPSKEIQAAIEWLQIKLKDGPIKPSEAKNEAPVSWRTLCKAKVKLGLFSMKKRDGWLWFDFKSTEPIMTPNPAKTFVNPLDEPEEIEPIRMTTESLIHRAKELVEDWRVSPIGGEVPDLAGITRELILCCTKWPMPEPYSKEYIKSVAKYVVDGDPIMVHLNNNKDEQIS
jgi:hypothetical protein